MISIFTVTIYQPLYNVLIFFYNLIPGHDFGIAIILTTVIIKLILYPVSKKQIESQKKLQDLQPKIKEIQNKHKNDKEKQTRELMDFYKKNKTNPFSGCLPLIVQLIFLIAIYRILLNISGSGLNIQEGILYSFIHNPGSVNHFFLGIVDLSKPSIYMAIMAALAQFYQSKMLIDDQKNKNKGKLTDRSEPDFTKIMNKQMLYLGPILTLFIGIKFAAGLSLYWLVSTLFMIFQQYHLTNKKIDLTKMLIWKKKI